MYLIQGTKTQHSFDNRALVLGKKIQEKIEKKSGEVAKLLNIQR